MLIHIVCLCRKMKNESRPARYGIQHTSIFLFHIFRCIWKRKSLLLSLCSFTAVEYQPKTEHTHCATVNGFVFWICGYICSCHIASIHKVNDMNGIWYHFLRFLAIKLWKIMDFFLSFVWVSSRRDGLIFHLPFEFDCFD